MKGDKSPDDQIVSKLQTLGFTLNDARVYLALVEFGDATPAELAVRCGIDRTRAYDSLKRLKTQHFVREESTKSRPKYCAEDPEAVFGGIQKEFNEKLATSQKLAETLKNKYKKPEMPHDTYWNIEGMKKIKEILKSIIIRAQKRLSFILTTDILREADVGTLFKAIIQKFSTLTAPRPTVQLILPVSTLENPETITPHLEELERRGATIFNFASKLMPFGLYLNERSFLFIPASDFSGMPAYESGIWIEDANQSKLMGFSHLADWFLRLTREGLLSPWHGEEAAASDGGKRDAKRGIEKEGVNV